MGLSQTANTPAQPRRGGRGWLLPLLLCALGAVGAVWGDDGLLILRYDRAALASGEFWRLLSGHLAHLGWAHYALNIAGLVLVWLLVGHVLDTRQWFFGLLGIVATIDLGFWFLNPELSWYVGLSGVLHGLLVAGLILDLSNSRTDNLIVLTLVGAKLLYEQLLGPLPGSEASAGGPVVVDAHLYGAVAGAVLAAVCKIRVPAMRSI